MSWFSEMIGEPEGKVTVEHSDGINQDIIDTIHKDFPEAVKQSSLIAQKFRGTTNLGTAYKIWSFLRKNIKYKRDPWGKQYIRLPRAFLKAATGDCKSYSLFAASILANLKMPVSFRYASYDGSGVPSHVYVVTQDENGKEIILDGVYKFFNRQKKGQYKTYPMEISTISGFPNVSSYSIAGKKSKKSAQKKADKKAKRKEKIKNLKKKVGKGLKKVGKVAKKVLKASKKVALAPARTAWLLLVRENVHGWGTKTAKGDQASKKKAWESVGGNWDVLKKTAALGAKKKRILGVGSYIGEPATFATALASAAPIIAIFTKLFKRDGTSDSADDKAANDASAAYKDQTGQSADDVAKAAITTSGDSFAPPASGGGDSSSGGGSPDASGSSGGSSSGEGFGPSASGGTSSTKNSDDQSDSADSGSTGFKLGGNAIIIAAGAALLLLVSMKKK